MGWRTRIGVAGSGGIIIPVFHEEVLWPEGRREGLGIR